MKSYYDERQVGLRRRFDSLGLLVMSTLVILDAWVNDQAGPWGSSVEQAMTIVLVTGVFTEVPTILSGAYVQRGETTRNALGWMVLLLLAMAVAFGGLLLFEHLGVWSHGHTQPGFLPAVMLASSTVTVVTLAVQWWRERAAARS